MSRLMSVAMTTDAVVERRKTVTRRKGWLFAKPGDRIVLVRKAMGRKPGEPLVRLAEVEIVSVRREPLNAMLRNVYYSHDECAAEGFPNLSPAQFIHQFFIDAQGIGVDEEVTRIEWKYLDTYTRPSTDDVRLPEGGKRITLKRICNGCERELGDVNDDELEASRMGRPLSSVMHECGRHVGEPWIDRQGDVWQMGEDGLMHSFETAAFTADHVWKKWGPLRPLLDAEAAR